MIYIYHHDIYKYILQLPSIFPMKATHWRNSSDNLPFGLVPPLSFDEAVSSSESELILVTGTR